MYIFFSYKVELYETVNKSVSSDGNVMYDVLVYTGEVIDTIEESGELYNIVKFKQDNCFTGTSTRTLRIRESFQCI